MELDQKLIKKIGLPKYKDGDCVKTAITEDKVLTVKGYPKSNGLTWMYSFKEDTMKLGQMYLLSI
jgi:hypothetical protein